MDFGIIFSIIISLILIIIIHNLFIYFKDNLTAPKVKDFINKPNKNYEEIFSIIDNKENNINSIPITTSNIDSLPNIDKILPSNNLINNNNNNLIKDEKNNDDMKLELKKFLNNLGSN